MSEIITNIGLLKRKSQVIPMVWFKTGAARVLEKELLDTVKEVHAKRGHRPLGLSAIQIDKPMQMCVIFDRLGFHHTIINPLIIDNSISKVNNFETCLSYPGCCFIVERYTEITVRYVNIKGKVCTKRFKGRFCRELQHEIDHFNGKVPTAQQIKSGKSRYKYMEVK